MTTPNPGSDEAVDAGCTCPVMDNAHGRGLPGGEFWITSDCPVHGEAPDDEQHKGDGRG